MEDVNIEQRQVLLYKNVKKYPDIELQYRIENEKVVLNTLKNQNITVNIRNAAEKIEEYPLAIQKLVWRALHYKCEIETRSSIRPTTQKFYEKLTKYSEAFKQTQKLILKMCKKYNFNGIIIESVK